MSNIISGIPDYFIIIGMLVLVLYMIIRNKKSKKERFENNERTVRMYEGKLQYAGSMPEAIKRPRPEAIKRPRPRLRPQLNDKKQTLIGGNKRRTPTIEERIKNIEDNMINRKEFEIVINKYLHSPKLIKILTGRIFSENDIGLVRQIGRKMLPKLQDIRDNIKKHDHAEEVYFKQMVEDVLRENPNMLRDVLKRRPRMLEDVLRENPNIITDIIKKEDPIITDIINNRYRTQRIDNLI